MFTPSFMLILHNKVTSTGRCIKNGQTLYESFLVANIKVPQGTNGMTLTKTYKNAYIFPLMVKVYVIRVWLVNNS